MFLTYFTACPNIKPRKSLCPPNLDSLDSHNQFSTTKKPTDYYSLSNPSPAGNPYNKSFSIKDSVSNILKKYNIGNTSIKFPSSSKDYVSNTGNSTLNILRRFSYDCERDFKQYTPQSYIVDTTDSSNESNDEEWSKFTIMNVTGIFKKSPSSKSRKLTMESHSNINLTGKNQGSTDEYLDHCFNSFIQHSGSSSGKKKSLENDSLASSSRKRSYSTSMVEADISLPSTSGLCIVKRGKFQ